MTDKEKLFDLLKQKDISFHEIPVESDNFPPEKDFWVKHNILRCKNLFFRDNHGKNHFLVVFDYYKQIDIKNLQSIVGRGSLSFASGWRLEKYLGLQPGFISMFGIINDEENHVKVIIDKALQQEKPLSFLPNTRGKSFIAMNYSEVIRFLQVSGNEFSAEVL